MSCLSRSFTVPARSLRTGHEGQEQFAQLREGAPGQPDLHVRSARCGLHHHVGGQRSLVLWPAGVRDVSGLCGGLVDLFSKKNKTS